MRRSRTHVTHDRVAVWPVRRPPVPARSLRWRTDTRRRIRAAVSLSIATAMVQLARFAMLQDSALFERRHHDGLMDGCGCCAYGCRGGGLIRAVHRSAWTAIVLHSDSTHLHVLRPQQSAPFAIFPCAQPTDDCHAARLRSCLSCTRVETPSVIAAAASSAPIRPVMRLQSAAPQPNGTALWTACIITERTKMGQGTRGAADGWSGQRGRGAC